MAEPTEPTRKSTVDEIRDRFDAEVDRFSNLDTGQAAAMDAPLLLRLVVEAAAETTPNARAMLDIGCGAGNFTLRMLQRLPGLDVTLVDLSRPMLDRAVERLADDAVNVGVVRAVQGDVRDVNLDDESVDVIVAGSVLHHLRTDVEWRAVFAKLFRWLRPGGSVWISDLICDSTPGVERVSRRLYGEYLEASGGAAYRERVFGYIAMEDTPRPVLEQLDLLRDVGFSQVDLLHKHACFAAFGGVKA
ncbi:MAG: methyltransferase domain-containing protein [Phycisphaera sp.]|nr:methyltransferase domain-containing protein [Phycisphaera sp.]